MGNHREIIIADDHEIFLEGMVSIINHTGGFKVKAQVANGLQLFEYFINNPPDMIITDIKMPVMDGIEAVKKIRGVNTEIPILILSMFGDEVYIKDLMAIGINGYLLKNSSLQDVRFALHAVADGKHFFSNDLIPLFVNRYLSKKQLNRQIDFTPREIEILQCIANGMTSNKIAAYLSISHKTVLNHRNNLLAKAGVNNTAALLAFAIKNNLIRFS